MFRAAAAAAVSPASVVGPRSRRRAQPAPTAQPPQRTRSSRSEANFDSYSVTSDNDDSFDAAFDEINIELTSSVSGSNQRFTTVFTSSVSPSSPAPAAGKRRAGATPNNKRASSSGASTPATPGKRGRRTATNTTSFTLIETQTNYLEDKPKGSGSFAGEEVLRISSVVIEEDVDILN